MSDIFRRTSRTTKLIVTSFASYTGFAGQVFILLLGFVFGNLFPTFCGEFLGKAYILILISLESFNYFYYSATSRVSRNVPIQYRKTALRARTFFAFPGFAGISIGQITLLPKSLSISWANCLKLGFLFGLFVDAFKVGS